MNEEIKDAVGEMGGPSRLRAKPKSNAKLWAFVIAVLVFVPLIVIWALRQLGAHATYDFGSWLAVIVLATAIKHVQK